MSTDEKVTWLCVTLLRVDLAVTSIQGDVSDLQEDVAALKTDVATLKTDVSEIKTLLQDRYAEARNVADVQVAR